MDAAAVLAPHLSPALPSEQRHVILISALHCTRIYLHTVHSFESLVSRQRLFAISNT